MCAAVYRQRHLVKATEVTAGLAESNGSLLPGLWRDSLHVTCGLTACTPGSARGPTLGNEYGKTLPLLHTFNGHLSRTTQVSQYQKGKTDLRKSAACSRQITMPAPHYSVFYRPDALPDTQPTVSKH